MEGSRGDLIAAVSRLVGIRIHRTHDNIIPISSRQYSVIQTAPSYDSIVLLSIRARQRFVTLCHHDTQNTSPDPAAFLGSLITEA